MSTSLAAQLQNIASLDAGRLISKYGQPSSKSYLFPAKVAETHDLDAVHALGQSGFDELVQLDEGMEEFEEELFSESAKRNDRMMLNEEENAKLDETLARCLRRLGKWIGIMAGGKCIEWLVRRFRVHEMNAEVLLQVFLPYHDSSNFARVLAILTLPTTSAYHAPFAALAKKAQAVPREYIVSAISSARDPSLRLLTDVATSVKAAIDEDVVHRALLAFWSASLVDLLERHKATGRVPEGVVKILVEAFVTLVSRHAAGPEVNAAVYPPLVLLARCVRLADAPFAAVVEALLTPGTGANPSQRILTLLVLLDPRKGWEGLGENAPVRLAKIPQLGELLVAAMHKYGFGNAVSAVVSALVEDVTVSEGTLTTLVDAELPPSIVTMLADKLLQTPSDGHAAARTLLGTLRQRHPVLIDNAVVSTSADPALVQWTAAESAFVDVHSADVASRVSGVNEMYAVAEAAGLTKDNVNELITDDKLKSAQHAVLARLRDTDEPVLSALYAKPELLVALLTGTNYVEAVTPAFIATKPDQTVLTLHLAFIAQNITDAAVFEKLLLPNLVATESRRAFGPEQWQLASKASRLLERVTYEANAVKFNALAVKALADAIAACGDIGAQVDILVRNLASALPATRLAATLTLAQLVSSAGGYQSVVATRSLDTLETYLAGKPLRDVHEVEAPLSEGLLKAVATKPGNAKTQQRAYLSLLTTAAAIQSTPAFLGEGNTIAHSLYRWANSANLADKVSKHLLQAVLGQLGEDALTFLASVWTSAADSALRVAALRHAAAFVKAYANKPTDFQLLIPAILIALQDSAHTVRQAAAALLQSLPSASASADIYALENVYGPRSDLAQLLKPSDLGKYLDGIKAELDDMVVDAGRLALVHGKKLALDAKKKDAHKRDVVDWLMSHVLAWRQLSARRTLLSLLDRTTNVSRLHGVLPLLDEAEWLGTLPLADKAEYLDLVFDAFAPKHAAAVTEADSDVWAFLLKVVATPSQLRTLSLQRMESLFAALKPAQKAEYIVAAIQSLHGMSIDDKLASKETLAKLVLSAPECISVICTLLEPLDSPVHRKKAKTEDEDRTEAAVADITVFVESRNWKSLRGDANVVASLMAILSAVLTKRQAIKEGVDYLEQEVLGGILAQIEQITDADAILRAHIGLEVIVKVIRASSNPRTSQRALLVASELARLIPDAVLHNVMPIFTFMGSSDLQRDDEFSFGVVEKTVECIVPVMAASLKDKVATELELYTEAKTFLSIFTDMASRLPKHRTLPFFVHLVRSLGNEFLPPVCMLLADRKKADLALSLAGAFPAAVRSATLLETVLEAKRGDSEGFLEPNASVLFQFATAVAKSLQGKVCPQPIVLQVVSELVESVDEAAEATLTAAMQLLSVDSFLEITASVLERDGDDVTRTLELFSARLPLIKPELRGKSSSMAVIIKRAAGLLQGGKASYALTALDRVVATSVPSEVSALAAIVPTVVAATKSNASALSLLAALVRRLGPRSIPFIQSVLDACLAISRAPPSPEVAHLAFDTIASLVDTVPTFVNSKQLVALLGAAAAHRAADAGGSAHLLAAVAKRIPSKTLIPVVMDLWKSLKGGAQAPTEAFFALLRNALRHADRKALPALTKSLFAFFLDVFDQRHGSTLPEDTLAVLETSAIASFLELVTKLSEAGFKPLFSRLYDWAVVDLPDAGAHAVARRTVLLRVMDGLLDKFRHLLTPYMATLVPFVDETLDAYAAGEQADARLWALLLAVVAKSLDVDDGTYWTDALALKLLPRVVSQLAVLPDLASGPDSPPAATLAAMAAATSSEAALKKINNAVLLASRAEAPRARLAALRALDAMWERHADELIQFVPETVAEFLAELLEDENAEVEQMARRVLSRIEAVTGSLKEYLE